MNELLRAELRELRHDAADATRAFLTACAFRRQVLPGPGWPNRFRIWRHR